MNSKTSKFCQESQGFRADGLTDYKLCFYYCHLMALLQWVNRNSGCSAMFRSKFLPVISVIPVILSFTIIINVKTS